MGCCPSCGCELFNEYGPCKGSEYKAELERFRQALIEIRDWDFHTAPHYSHGDAAVEIATEALGEE